MSFRKLLEWSSSEGEEDSCGQATLSFWEGRVADGKEIAGQEARRCC